MLMLNFHPLKIKSLILDYAFIPTANTTMFTTFFDNSKNYDLNAYSKMKSPLTLRIVEIYFQ